MGGACGSIHDCKRARTPSIAAPTETIVSDGRCMKAAKEHVGAVKPSDRWVVFGDGPHGVLASAVAFDVQAFSFHMRSGSLDRLFN